MGKFLDRGIYPHFIIIGYNVMKEIVYQSPSVEIIEVEVEKGFANSNEPYDPIPGEWD